MGLVNEESMKKIYLIIAMYVLCQGGIYAQLSIPSDNVDLILDSVKVPASTRYAPASFLRKIFTGKNYRKEWSTPVTLPVLDLEKTGLAIVKMGGGMQTKSLRLVDKQGREWALRTVDKFAEGAVPPGLRNTLAEKVVQDMISASYPYAAVTVGALAEAMGITAPRPVVYFVPDADFLGPYRTHFANLVCYLEKREPVPGTLETGEVMFEKLDDNDNLLLQKEILRARLLDMLIADWDRHEGQWLWAEKDSAGSKYHYPVPLDRDQAFFMSGGLISKIAKLLAMPHINSFKKKSNNIRNLSYKSWEFDRFFLNSLNAQEWTTEIIKFREMLTDQVIEKAVQKLPREVYAISGPEIISILKSRRDGMLVNAMKYYQFLSTSVDVAGTNEDEIFRISSKDGMTLTAFTSDNGRPGKKLYERNFRSSETKEVVIYGLEGDDHFIVEENVDDDIRLHIYGNRGKDVYDIKGSVKSRIFDFKKDDNLMLHTGSSRVLFED